MSDVHPFAFGSDKELIDAVRRGDLSAADALVRDHLGIAVRVAKSIVDPDTAQDVAADSIEKLLRAIRDGKGPAEAVRPYLIRIVRNTATDYHRRRREIPDDTVADEGEINPDHAGLVEDAVVLRAAMESLPERWQQVLWMTYVEDADKSEIAARLGLRAGATAQLTMRARDGLRAAYLAQFVPEEGSACRPIRKRLPSYILGKAGARGASHIEEHLDDCASCRRLVAGLRGISGPLGVVVAIAMAGSAAAFSTLRTPTTAAAATTAAVPRPRGVKHVAQTTAGSAVVAGVAVAVVATAAAAAVAVGMGITPWGGAGGGSGSGRGPGAAAAAPVPVAPVASTATPSASASPTATSSGTPSIPVTAPTTKPTTVDKPSASATSSKPTPTATSPSPSASSSTPSSTPTFSPTPTEPTSSEPTSSEPSPTPTEPSPSPTPSEPSPTPTPSPATTPTDPETSPSPIPTSPSPAPDEPSPSESASQPSPSSSESEAEPSPTATSEPLPTPTPTPSPSGGTLPGWFTADPGSTNSGILTVATGMDRPDAAAVAVTFTSSIRYQVLDKGWRCASTPWFIAHPVVACETSGTPGVTALRLHLTAKLPQTAEYTLWRIDDPMTIVHGSVRLG